MEDFRKTIDFVWKYTYEKLTKFKNYQTPAKCFLHMVKKNSYKMQLQSSNSLCIDDLICFIQTSALGSEFIKIDGISM